MQYNPTMHKLSNGITVLLDPMDLETVNVKVVFCTGSQDEAPHEYGLTHFCEHMLCKGTTRFPRQKAVDEYLDYNGGFKNACTGSHDLCFYGRIIAENLNVLIDVIADQLQNSLFDPAKIEIERRVVLDELRRAQDNPERQLGDFISDKLFNYAVSSTRTLGTAETISSFTRDQMLEFIGRRLSAKNCIIGISGKITDAAAVVRHLETAFAFLPTHEVSENYDINYTPAIAHNSKPDNKNVKLCVFFPDVRNNWQRVMENRFKRMCVHKFVRHMVRDLMDVIRRENGLVYGFSESTIGNNKFCLNGFVTQTSPENIATVVALIAENAYRIYTEQTITDADLIRLERKNKLADADFLESAGRRCDGLIGFYRDYGRVFDFYDAVKMESSIRRDDVIKYSRGYFDGPMSIITQGADFDADLACIWHENFNGTNEQAKPNSGAE